MANGLFSKTGALAQFIVRRDRLRLFIWLMSFVLLTTSVVMTFTEMYISEAERQAMAATMNNPAMIAMVGPGFGLDNYTVGAMTSHQMLLFTAIAVALMSILLVARHTRTDEESGRIELIRSLPTGRLSNLSATLIVAIGSNIVLALLIGISLFAMRIESMDFNGSMLYGAALGVTGIFFAALTAVFAQLSEHSRGTIGLSLALLIGAYLIRAVGDVGDGTLSWFSPLGWILYTEAFVNNYWSPILLTLVASLALIVIALYLNARRDLGAGLIPAKPGRAHASVFLQSPLGLALRLQRTALIAWAIGMFVLGTSYGSVFGDLEDFLENVTFIEEMLGSVTAASITDQFLTMVMAVMAMMSAIPVLMTVNKLVGEEQHDRVTHLLSRVVSRMRLMGSYVVTAMITTVVMLSLTALGLWSAVLAVMDEPVAFATYWVAAISYLPALWIMMSIAVLLVGWAPKMTSISWLFLLYSFIVVYLGGILDFPEWLANVTPFGHISQYPIEDLDVVRLLVLTAVAAIITIIGFVGYQKRDIDG